MKNYYKHLIAALGFAAPLIAQATMNVDLPQGTVSLPTQAVDLMQADPATHHIHLSYPTSSATVITPTAINATDVDLSNEKPQSFNVINTLKLAKTANTKLPGDIEVELGAENELTIALPYLYGETAIAAVMTTTGSCIFVNDKQWSSGNTLPLNTPLEVKCVAFDGDVQTYRITISTTALPYLELNTKKNIEKEWTESSLNSNNAPSGSPQVKGKGSHFANGLKNNYALKFADKTSLLDITKNKRWLLLAGETDNTLQRANLGYWLSEQIGATWTPVCKMANLSINGQFSGCYMLVEQPRICKGRFDSGYLLSVEQDADYGDDSFRSNLTQTLFVFEDPDAGSKGTALIRTKSIIDRFEKALMAEDWNTAASLADLKSMAQWLVVNELSANADAFSSDTYINITEDGTIRMLPAWNLKKAFGAENSSTAVNTASQTPWMMLLLKNPAFLSMVKEEYAKARKLEPQLMEFIDIQSTTLAPAALANNAVWHNMGTEAYGSTPLALYTQEVERLKAWINARLKWLDAQW